MEAVSDEPGGKGLTRPVTAVLLLAAFVVAFTQGAVIPALPLFRRQLGVSASSAAWLVTAFMLASAVVTPIAGRLGDLLGHRPVLLACLGCLAAGGALAAAADHAGWFGGVLAGRALQGVSGGVFPLTFGLARHWTPPGRLHGVIAALSAMFGVGGALAMAVAGPLAGALGTAALSLLSVLITFLALAGVLIRLPRGDTPARTGRHGTVLDLPGTLLLAAALVALLLGVTQGRTWGWGSAATLATLISALVLGAGFAAVESRSSEPVVDPRLLRGRGPALTHLATFVISVAMFAAVTLIPQYAQTPAHAGYGFGTSATGTGLLLAPMAVAMVAAAPLSTRLAARAGSGTAFRAGAALAATTLAALGVAHGALWQFALAGTALGVAYGFAFASLGGLVVNAVRPDRTGAATGVNTLLRTLGGAVGAQLAAVIITGSAAAPPTETGYTVAFLASAAVAAVALALSAALPRTRTPDGRRPDRSPSRLCAVRRTRRDSAQT
ncbi:MFS transporter [Streptomyces iranensis]|uniref:MFS family permease n=1 Tax=Streptomyces iranensis TaxID=576784 RepID=A0A061ADA7_9ACTN|nr:MFS transporter [Streptomyces iranensis]MBP2063543.1 MFS family permease [Streptomyces iranensis]CDR17877.1 major facilitator superfamily MFS_1 [Streptomyces iranensis]